MGLHRVRHDWSDLAYMHALEKEMATHSSILPGTEEPGGLLSMGSHRVGHDWSDLVCMHGKRRGLKFLKFVEVSSVPKYVVNPRECSLYPWKGLYSGFLKCNILKISIKSICSVVSFRFSVALLIFCLEDLSLDVSGVLKSPTVVMFPSVSFLCLFVHCFMCLGALY